jgi:hypothetical protein
MRRSLIAVCLVLLAPLSVKACYEDHNPAAGWAEDKRPFWSNYGIGAEGVQRDRLMDVSMFAGGSGVLILLGVSLRAFLLAARRDAVEMVESASLVPLALPTDGPPCEPQCVLTGLDSQDDTWAPVDFRDVSDEAFPGVTLPVDSLHCLV